MAGLTRRTWAICKHHAVEQEGQQREHYKNNAGPDAFVVLQNAARLLKIRRTDARFGLQTVAMLHTVHVLVSMAKPVTYAAAATDRMTLLITHNDKTLVLSRLFSVRTNEKTTIHYRATVP
jgi:hypothetical protein